MMKYGECFTAAIWHLTAAAVKSNKNLQKLPMENWKYRTHKIALVGV